ncbi:MAG: DUF5655 domain-containing protein [Actinobacteria bacterium]|nr:DUF5655 domain-containing protein [Actinomycetota bacterium]
MAIFKIENQHLVPIKEMKFDLEKDIQKTTEENLEVVFGYALVRSEFTLNNLRIDTLAYDSETQAFVIIEYKKDRNFSVIDQGYSYLALLLNNKADFILEYNARMNDGLKRDDIDWSQSRVLFISPNFTTHQKGAIDFKDLPIELWEVKAYENDTLRYNQLKAAASSESIKTVTKDKTIKTVSREVREYTLEDHFKTSWQASRELFDELREKVLDFDSNTKEKILKHCIAYEINNRNFAEIVAQKSGLKIYLDDEIQAFKKTKMSLKDCSKVGHWATGNTVFHFSQPENIDDAVFLIKQVYEKYS